MMVPIYRFMAEFKFFCPLCGQRILVDTGYSGQQINCPVCQKPIVVPQAPTTAGHQYPVTPVAQPAVLVQSNIGKNALIVLASVLVLALLGFGGWYGYSKLNFGHHLPGLIAMWSGEGNGNDSVSGNNAQLKNVTYAEGKVGQAFSFNGGTASLRIPYAPNLICPAFTIDAWINPSAQASDHFGQSLIFGQGFGAFQLVVRREPTGVYVVFQFGSDRSTFPEVRSAEQIPAGQFSHAAGTWDGKTLRLYINGVLNAQNTPGKIPADSGCDFFIGGFDAPDPGSCQYVGQFFAGQIDELGFYNRALSGEEIQKIYTSQN